MRILVIEDSEKLRFHLGEGMRKLGHEARLAADGREGLWEAKSGRYDMILLDLMLPGIDGLSILTQLRKEGIETAVLILTAKDRLEDRVKGLKMGADDYLVKPFAFDELEARIEAVARRIHGKHSGQIALEGLTLDLKSRSVLREGLGIELSAREFNLLEFLAQRRGRVFSRAEIEARICDENAEVSSNVVDAAIYSLRKKIDEPGKPSLIATRRGMGYSIRNGDESCPSDSE
jgi:DNA-binding response OmpR family regulator